MNQKSEIKRLVQCIKQYKKESILSPLMVIGEVTLDIIMPYLMALIIDNGISKGDMSYILNAGMALFACALLALLCGVLSGTFAATASTGFAKNVRQEMYDHIQNFSFSNIDKFTTASLVTRLTTDTTNLQISYQMIIRILVRSPLILLFSTIMAYRIHKELSLIFCITIPILGLGLYLIQSKAQPIFKKVFRIYDNLNRVIQENLRGIRVIKSYVREEQEVKKFNIVSQDLYQKYVMAEKLLALNNPVIQLVMYGCMTTLFWRGGHLIVAGSLTAGRLVSLVTYVMQTLVNLTMLSMVFVMITISRASIQRVTQVLNEQSHLHNPEHPTTAVIDGSISFKNVSFSYSGADHQLCLSNVNFSIESGQTVGIVGGTGSAKTTLVQLIPRLYDATAGSVEVGGINVNAYDLEVLRNNVGIVLQKNVLFSGTIKENLKWGNPNVTDEEIIQVCKLAQAHHFIKHLPQGYDSYLEQGGLNISGGQKQRLCIARTLLKKPKILILDDSTSAVDAKTDAKLQESLMKALPNTTKIIITQRISSIEHTDQIFVLDDGAINAIGDHSSLLSSNKIYQEMYQSQQQGGTCYE